MKKQFFFFNFQSSYAFSFYFKTNETFVFLNDNSDFFFQLKIINLFSENIYTSIFSIEQTVCLLS